jgi:hypothetical protein
MIPILPNRGFCQADFGEKLLADSGPLPLMRIAGGAIAV